MAMLTLLGTCAIINGARLSLCRIAMVDARSAPGYDILTMVGFVIWERGPMSLRVASCLLLLMATEMRPLGVHVAWAHGMDDSERAGTVNTHCWKVARVVFVSSDKGAVGKHVPGCLGYLRADWCPVVWRQGILQVGRDLRKCWLFRGERHLCTCHC